MRREHIRRTLQAVSSGCTRPPRPGAGKWVVNIKEKMKYKYDGWGEFKGTDGKRYYAPTRFFAWDNGRKLIVSIWLVSHHAQGAPDHSVEISAIDAESLEDVPLPEWVEIEAEMKEVEPPRVYTEEELAGVARDPFTSLVHEVGKAYAKKRDEIIRNALRA